MPCDGCAARDAEIAYLRAQNDRLIDRMLAAANPSAYAQVTGQKPAEEGAVCHYTDVMGQSYRIVDGRAVKEQDFQTMLREQGGYIDGDGRYVGKAEYEAAMTKLNGELAGTPMGGQQLV